jgi:L-lactate utilization protein LutC
MHVAPFVACRPRAVVQKAMLLQRTLQNVFFHKQVHGLKERCRDIHTSCVRLYSEALMQALFQHIQIDALDKWRKGK